MPGFLTNNEVKEDTLSYVMRMIAKSDNDDENANQMPQDSVRNTLEGRNPEFVSLLKEQFDENIPFDITFEIVEKEEGDDADENNRQVKGNKRNVKAHKMILATFSPVFRKMFFGPMKESKDIIPIKETTVDAFNKLIEYFYQVDIDCGEIDVIELFDILNLAERYNVPKLKEELKEQVKKVPIDMKNLVEVGAVALKFSHFEDVSSALLLHCAKVFQKKVRTAAAQVQFMQEQQARGEFAVIAAKYIISLSKTVMLPPPATISF